MDFHKWCPHKTSTRKYPWAPSQSLSPIVRSSQTAISIACFVLFCVSTFSHSMLYWWALSTLLLWCCDLLIFSATFPFCEYTTGVYPFSCWDFWVVSGLGLLWMKLLWTFRYEIWGEHLCTFCCMYLGMELLGHMVCVFGRYCQNVFQRGCNRGHTHQQRGCPSSSPSTVSPAVSGICLFTRNLLAGKQCYDMAAYL